MTYLFSSNSVITNEVEIKNESGNAISTRMFSNGNFVSASNPFPVTLGSDSITITGNVNVSSVVQVNSTPEQPVHNHITEIGNSGIITVPYMPIGGNVSITAMPTVNIGNILEVVIKNDNTDAFGRSRISEPFTLGDYKHLYGLDPNFIDYAVNGGAVAFQTNKACARLSTTSNTSSRIVHQTKFYHHYMPGKSQVILSSFNFYSATANVTKRAGYFDDSNGIFLEQIGNGTLSFVVRSFVSGAPVERRIAQSNWTNDRCNGTGPSGFNIDITKTQLWWCDFQWLGVGRVRCGFVHNGEYVFAHEFDNSNNLDTVYMSNPNLPVRCEILNTGTTAGAYFDQICSTVISEGGYVEAGQDWAVTNTPRTLTSGQTLPIMAIRLKNTFKTYPNRILVRMGNLQVFSSGENIKWILVKLPDSSQLTETTWTSVNTDSAVEYNVDATAFTGGDEIDNGFVAASTQGSQRSGGSPGQNMPSSAKKNYIVQNYDSTNSEIYVLVATNLGSSSTTVGVGMQWREIY